jgi:hypothetical protein
MVTSNVLEYAKRKGVTREVRQIDRWLKKLGKRGIVGGTAIGKYYNALILDTSFQDGAIYYGTDTGIFEVHNKRIPFTFKAFKKAMEETGNK